MGRAGAQPTSGFDTVFGLRRGLSGNDTLTAKNPTPIAREALRELILAPTFLSTDLALTALREHYALIGERPLLNELADLLAQAAVNRALGVHAQSVRLLMEVSGLRTSFAEQVFFDGRNYLHLCEHGREFGLGHDLQTLCEIVLARSDIHAAARGAWLRPLASTHRRCQVCEDKLTPGIIHRFPDCNESANYPPLDARTHAQALGELSSRVRSHLDSALSEDSLPDEDELSRVAAVALTDALTAIVAQQLYDGDDSVCAHALGHTYWQSVRDHAPSAGAQTLDYEDWLAWVQMWGPHFEHNLSALERQRQRERARKQLFSLFADELGMRHH